MNDWYEKGEFPPLGESVRYYCAEDLVYKVVEVVAHRGNAAVVIDEDDNANVVHIEHLKPIHLEREEFIAEVQELMGCKEDWNIQCVSETAHAMFKVGYRKVQPLTLRQFNLAYQNQTNEQLYHWLINCNHIVSEGE